MWGTAASALEPSAKSEGSSVPGSVFTSAEAPTGGGLIAGLCLSPLASISASVLSPLLFSKTALKIAAAARGPAASASPADPSSKGGGSTSGSRAPGPCAPGRCCPLPPHLVRPAERGAAPGSALTSLPRPSSSRWPEGISTWGTGTPNRLHSKGSGCHGSWRHVSLPYMPAAAAARASSTISGGTRGKGPAAASAGLPAPVGAWLG
mmetsp:Transcript_11024/g.37535  ORF Transcript_11024/g.37535 Transcript_11024/m.37535 type:complete len:207 (+) Transcript_11024:384-1004(+)